MVDFVFMIVGWFLGIVFSLGIFSGSFLKKARVRFQNSRAVVEIISGLRPQVHEA
jgi:hypothetical protein